MFDSILAWFSSARSWLDWLWRECWRQAGNVVTSVWGVLLIVIGWIYTGCKWIGDTVAEMARQIDAVAMPDFGHGTPMTEGLAMINTFLPLQELLGFIVAYVGLRVILQGYSFIKSWIPTLS